jgi:hypothetical protein
MSVQRAFDILGYNVMNRTNTFEENHMEKIKLKDKKTKEET